MKKHPHLTYPQVRARVSRIQKIYSAIGEPLPVDLIFDLCRCLPMVLRAAKPPKHRRFRSH